MKEFVKVYDRVTGSFKDVSIKSSQNINIDETVLLKWQGYLDTIAKSMGIPSVLIMIINDKKELEVFLTNNNNEDNVYKVGHVEETGQGLYCESVVANDDKLLVPNALEDENWKDNPDIKNNMTSYLGLPLKWSDNDFFGTVCILDNKEIDFNPKYEILVNKAKELIELDLKEMEEKQKARLNS